MAAVISTGTATNNIDLLQKLVTWLVGRGYTSNKSESYNGGWRAHLNKGSVYVNLCATFGAIGGPWQSNATSFNHYALHLYLGSAYSGAAAWKDQGGGPVQSGTNYAVGSCAVTGSGAITSYQFIDDGNDNIFIIIERSPGIYRILYWGGVIKYGIWTGGAYFGGSDAGYYGSVNNDTKLSSAVCPLSCNDINTNAHGCFVRADVDAFQSKWLCGGVTTNKTPALSYTGKFFQSGIDGSSASHRDVPAVTGYLASMLHSTMSGRIFLLPVPVYAARDAGGYSLLGEVPSLRLCKASSGGMSIGTDVSIGSETWRVFNGFAVRVV